jgi:hypothetical protein
MPELLDGLVDAQFIVLDLLQQSFYLFSLNISPNSCSFCGLPRVQKRNFAHPTNSGYELLAFGSSVKSAKSPALNLL